MRYAKIVEAQRRKAELCSAPREFLGDEARATAASEVLKKISGRDIKLADLARSNGAAIAANLLLHAERLATRLR